MAENSDEGVKQPAEAQQEVGTQEGQDQNQVSGVSGQEAFNHPEVKKRLAQLSAAKNQALQEAERYKAERARFEQQYQQVDRSSSSPDADYGSQDTDEDTRWAQETIVKPIYNQVMSTLAPVLDETQRNSFWSQFPEEDFDVIDKTEGMVAQLRQNGQHNVDRNILRQVALGQKYEEQRKNQSQQSQQSQQQMEKVNQVARPAQGATPQPAPQNQEPNFDTLSVDEKFNRLSQDGILDQVFGTRGGQR